MKRIILLLILLLGAAFGIMMLMSPYGRDKDSGAKLIKTTIDINRPPIEVFDYLGNSANAKEWSVFVDHITPLNADSVADGSVGSRRRCFVNADETGIVWDETITERIPAKKRQITIYNMAGFPLTADNLATEQIYQPINDGATRLTFTVFYLNAKPTLFEEIKTYIAAYKIKNIFDDNLANIKKYVETK